MEKSKVEAWRDMFLILGGIGFFIWTCVFSMAGVDGLIAYFQMLTGTWLTLKSGLVYGMITLLTCVLCWAWVKTNLEECQEDL